MSDNGGLLGISIQTSVTSTWLLHAVHHPSVLTLIPIPSATLHVPSFTEPEQNEMKDLHDQLTETTALVKMLSHQLGDLRD